MPNDLNLVEFKIEDGRFVTNKHSYPLDADGRLSFSVVEIPQGKTKFYTMSMYSDVLASLSYVIERSEDKDIGFQRYLNKDKAEEIAEYIDSGGTIPTSVILSAQSDIIEIDRRKLIKIKPDEFAFLVIDGQHRTFGFHLAQTRVRVPVVIYTNLTKDKEAQLFIDINAKQTKVPNDLLLEIVRLAKIETNEEAVLNDLFEKFSTEVDSALIGYLTGYPPEKGKLNRANFDGAIKVIIPLLGELEVDYIYNRLNPYLYSMRNLLLSHNCEDALKRAMTLKTILAVFPDIHSRARIISESGIPTSSDYSKVLKSISANKSVTSILKQPIKSYKQSADKIRKAFNADMVI